jgi:Ca2+-binding EF-hand superfamily protein
MSSPKGPVELAILEEFKANPAEANVLKPLEVEELREFCALFGKGLSSDDCLTAQDLDLVFTYLQIPHKDADIEKAIAKYGNNDSMSFDQMLAMRKDQVATRTMEEELRHAFRTLADPHGNVTKDALKKFLVDNAENEERCQAGEDSKKKVEEKMEELLTLADPYVSPDGKINIEAFIKGVLLDSA